MGQVIEERFDALLIHLLPIGSVPRFLQPVRVKNLLELVRNGDCQIRLAEMQGLGDQGESRIRDDRASTHQVREESIERRLLIQDVAFFVPAFAAEAVGDELAAHGAEQFRQRRGG